MEEIKLYAARDTVTKKLVSDITNPRRKYWDRRGNAESAIRHYNEYCANRGIRPYNKGKHNKLELVTFKLVEIEE